MHAQRRDDGKRLAIRLGRVAFAAAVLGVLANGPSRAQPPPSFSQPSFSPASVWPRCIAERDGQQIGQGGSVCECRHQRGGTMIDRPPGWRWSCDILRMDGSQTVPPAVSFEGRRYPLPGFLDGR